MKDWFLYLIRCKHGRLYTGITTDVERRFAEHIGSDKKRAKCLRGKAPLTLVMKKKIGSRSMALQIEARVKKLPKIKKEMFVDGKIKLREINI
ncbi:MAG: putative endonuclease [Planctomycetota bacterium]|nr:putative endonuclease [Planctomycetota bacterium]